MRALIVEDDLNAAKLMYEILSPYGDCDMVINGQEAIEAFEIAIKRKQPYDLICLDIMMPEMDGQEALRLIRKYEVSIGIKPEDEVKIIMTTAVDTTLDKLDAYYSGGCTDYITKPIKKEMILAFLKRYSLIER